MRQDRHVTAFSRVGEGSATALAMVVHELAINSVKHGALSVAAGRLAVTSAEHNGDLTVTWAERGGPPGLAPARRGFGSKLVARSVGGPLGGTIAYDWRAVSVAITLRVNKVRLAD